ncbi:MAG: ABC transporter substrate-binding protein [Ignavibacteria bacterium]|nr:ABC transporter substrate-binding protein [Ignavibacteria bacterium]
MRPALIAALFLPVLLAPIRAQDDGAGVERTFSDALALFERGQFAAAAARFDSLCERVPDHARSTAACIMAARAHARSYRPARSRALLERFPERFPGSRYAGEAAMLLGDVLVKLGEPRGAWKPYGLAWSAATEEGDRASALARLDSLARGEPDIRILDSLVSQPALLPCAAAVLLGCCEDAVARRNPRRAEDALRLLAPRALDAGQRARRDAARQRIAAAAAPARIAVVLPAPFDDLERNLVVRDLRDGLLTALDMHRQLGGAPVETELIVSSSTDSIRRVLRRLAGEERIVGIIGGVFSADASLLSRAASGCGVPCVIPAATAEDLATAGGNIFQLNTPFAVRGAVLAEYLATRNPVPRVAVLAPIETFARAIASAFIDRAKELSVPIEIVSWYAPGTKDYRSQYKTIAGRIPPDDSAAVLFLPVPSREQAAAILAGARAAGVRATLLGAGDWNHPALFTTSGMEGLRMEFESDYAVHTGFSQYLAFESAYRARTQRDVTRHAVFGYDAARFFLNALPADPQDRGALLRRLRAVYIGLRSPIDLSTGQANRGINIMTVQGGRISRLTTIPAE